MPFQPQQTIKVSFLKLLQYKLSLFVKYIICKENEEL